MNCPRHRVYIACDWTGGHRLFVCKDEPGSFLGGVVNVANGFTWKEHGEGDAFHPSADGIGQADDLIQAIVDKAWEAGFRPRGHSDVKNETVALREHLADMKTIAFHQLKIEKDNR